MSNLSKFLRSRLALRQEPADNHPDANLLSGFAEQELPVRARAAVLAHLARCAECRQILAFSMPEPSMARPALEKRGPAWHVWRWPAGAALAALVLAVALAPRWMVTPRAPVQPAVRQPSVSKLLPPVAVMTPAPRVIAKVPAPAPRKEIRAHAKRTESAPALAQIEEPALEAPPRPVPQFGFRRMDTAAISPNPTPETTTKRWIAASVVKPGRTSIWRIEQNGTVSKSQDGKAWAPVRVDQNTRVYALSADGAEVWAGGTGGGLFHSTDDGVNWRQVEIHGASGLRLTDTITRIGSAPQHPLELKTNSGAVWVSFDGRIWREQ